MTIRGPETFTAFVPPRIIAAVCEHYVVRSEKPFRLDELWPFTERLEHFGLAGFGWGAAWTDRRWQPRLVPRRPGVR